MSMQTAKAQLTKATKKLNIRWNEVLEHWDDPVSRSMESKHIDPLQKAVTSTIGAMENMAEMIARAKSECS